MKEIRTGLLLLLLFICFCSCNQSERSSSGVKLQKKDYVDSLYSLNYNFKVGDVRRYGVMPGKSIGEHPILKKDKLDVLLDLAEMGVELNFPKGVYDRTLHLEDRKNIRINTDSALFTGSIKIENSRNIEFIGSIQSLVQFYTRNVDNLFLDTIIVKSDTISSGSGLRSIGCEIHAGSNNVNINKIIVEDLGSGTSKYKYVKGGLIVHGHNNEPENVLIDSVVIKSSDRHGVYLTGNEVHIGYLNVHKFGVGDSKGMAAMEGGIEGEQINFSGLWVKNCHNSSIDKVIIGLSGSKGKYSVNFDIGESFRPFKIDSLILRGETLNTTIKERIFSRTAVLVNEKIIQ